MGVLVVLATLLALTHAGRLPYLGGDIDEVIQSSKQKDLTDPSAAWIVANQRPVEPKPITQKQKRDSTNYNSKFTDIARAYAEGYKAAIKAVQQRALIAKRRLHTIGKPLPLRPSANFLPPALFARSTIPQAPQPNTPDILNLQPATDITAKSTIPLPQIPEQIPGVGVGEVAPVSSPGPSSDRETNIPTLNGLPDTQSGKEEMVARSTIPEAPKEEKKSEVPTGEGSPGGMFAAAVSAQTTENAVEKSWIPGSRPAGSDSALNMNERSTVVEMPKYSQEAHPAFPHVPVHLRSVDDRDKIAKLNARARHRNIYFDGAGGDPFNGGGVLSRQNAISVTKHRRRRRRRRSSEDEWYFVPNPHYLARHRRSHMPYLGQNLDAMGVVRATPKSWTSAQVRKSIADAKAKQQLMPATQVAYNSPNAPIEVAPSPFTQSMPAQFRADIPQPPSMNMMPNPMALNFAGNLPGGIPGPMFAPQPGQFYRSMIPSYPFFNQMPGPFGFPFQAPQPAGVINEEPTSVESPKSSETLREKKSTIPTPADFDHEALQTVNFNA
jgi:hypothetical protein